MSVVQDRYARIALSAITLAPERQRSDIALDESFLDSVKKRGVLSPILVTNDHVLVAGGRRYSASVTCGHPDIPVRYVSEGLSLSEIELIELEENVRRADLPWQDEVLAVARLHTLLTSTRPDWTMSQTQEFLGYAQGNIHRIIRVAKALSNPEERAKVIGAPGMRAAHNICVRIDERVHDALMEEISEEFGLGGEDGEGTSYSEEGVGVIPPPIQGAPSSGVAAGTATPGAAGISPQRTSTSTRSPVPPESILCLDFAEWASTYSGPKFNFLHCDFPYGKRVFGGQWGGRDTERDRHYEDDPDVYWELCRVLAENVEKLCTSTCHLMFWTSSEIKNLYDTIEFFRERMPTFIFQPRALIWHKSDNTGIVPDPLRGPRWIAETCLMATRGDRPLVRPLASSYSAPTARSLHPSAKPEPVLRHFFGMFVDSTTRMLDPTCGAGSSLRAAESLGASSVLGIEKSEEFAKVARKELASFRSLKAFTEEH